MASSVASQNLHSVFVYGTLMADDVVRTQTRPLLLPCRSQRFGRVYPAILPAESKKVKGKVLLGLTDLELDVLDAFEDEEYERKTVEISLIDKPEKLFADVYFWADKNDPNLYGEWDFEEWEQLRMKELLTMTRDFIHESEQSETKSRVATYESHYGHDQLMI